VKEGSECRQGARANAARASRRNWSRLSKFAKDPHSEGVSEQIHPARNATKLGLADYFISCDIEQTRR
jgi:hypothetical protein